MQRDPQTPLSDGELLLFAQGHASPALVSAARELRDARLQLEAVSAAVRDVHAGRALGLGLAFEVERALAKRAEPPASKDGA